MNGIALSIVTTMYRSAPYLREFYERAREAALKITPQFEIILVNDGSPDNSLDLACAIHEEDERVVVVDLSRNFGQHKAMMTGLAHARGEQVFLIDCDLEEEPELLELCHGTMAREKADVVFGVQERRKGGVWERFSGTMFYTVFNWLSGTRIAPNLTTLRLMTARYVRSLVAHRDKAIFLAGLWEITGFRQIPVVIKKHYKGSTTYSFRKKLELIFNSVTSFSIKPLILIFMMGAAITLISVFYTLYLLVQYLTHGIGVGGWTSLMVSVWFLGGLGLFSLGVIGVYISRIFIETKDRPYTIVRAVHDRRQKLEEGGGRQA